MTIRLGRRAPVVLTALALAAAVGAAPAPAAETGHNLADLAACNALLPDSALGLGQPRRRARRRPGAVASVREPQIDATDIEIPAGSTPKVGKRFSATIPVYFHVISQEPAAVRRQRPATLRSATQIDGAQRRVRRAVRRRRHGVPVRAQPGIDPDRRTPSWFDDGALARRARGQAGAARVGGANGAQHLLEQRCRRTSGFAYYPKIVTRRGPARASTAS